MNRKLRLALLLALVGAASLSLLIFRVVSRESSGVAEAKMVQIVVAARRLDAGTVVHEPDVALAPWAGALPKGSATKTQGFLNRGVTSTIYEGEPVTENRLAATGTGGGLAAMIPHGMRACAVHVNEVVGVAGFVMPGMRVDVIISGRANADAALEGASVRTLLQNIQVLSSGANFLRDNEGKPQQAPVVTLLVTPEQAEVLSLASNETRIQLILRNPTDTRILPTPGAAVANLFGQLLRPAPSAAKPPPPVRPRAAAKGAPPEPPPTRSVEVLNGVVRTEMVFPRIQETR